MRNALIVYAAVVVVVSWLAGFGASSLPESQSQWGGMFFLLVPIATFAMAYVGHKLSGAVGNPFKGLSWGSTSWYFLVWILGLVAGAIVLVLSMGMGLAGFDPGMGDYIAMVVEQSKANGQEIPAEAMGTLKIGGYIAAFGAPTFGVLLGSAFAGLIGLSWLGWFGRRLLVHGVPTMVGVLMAVGFASAAATGLMDNPQMDELSLPVRMIILGFSGACFTPLSVWLFLKNRSVVIPAVAQVSYQAAFGAATPFLADTSQLFGPPSGAIVSVAVLGIGIGLWLLKDPGGRDMAIAAVAHDGTPLNPGQLAALDSDGHSEKADLTSPVGQTETVATIEPDEDDDSAANP